MLLFEVHKFKFLLRKTAELTDSGGKLGYICGFGISDFYQHQKHARLAAAVYSQKFNTQYETQMSWQFLLVVLFFLLAIVAHSIRHAWTRITIFFNATTN